MYPLPAASPFEALIDDLQHQGWSVRHDFLPPVEVAALREEALSAWRQGAFREAAVGRGAGRGVRPEVRGDLIRWLDEGDTTPAQGRHLARMETLRLELNRAFFLGLESFECHAALYPEGRGYQRHLDRFRGSEERLVTSVLYLNPDWRSDDGGQLRLYTEQGEVEVLPEAGTLATFVTDGMWHEVLPASRPRLALTGWFRRRPAGAPL